MIVFHHNDPDGRCAAAIVRLYYEHERNFDPETIDFVELNYHTHEFRSVEKNEIVYIVDYSFPPEIMNEILAVTENVVLIDHHASTPKKMKEYVGKYDAVVDCDGPESGCSLTWKYLFTEWEMPEALKLIRDYDTWTHSFFPSSTHLTTGLLLFDTNPESVVWDDLLGFSESPDYSAEDIVMVGRNCVEFRDELAKDACSEFGFVTKWEGYECFVIYCTTMRSSLFFGDRIEKYDMCIMVVPHGKGVTMRLYSNGQVDVSKVAEKYDGGGHKGAGGFVCETIPEEFLPGGKCNG